jgi:hypothetical protein
MRFNVHQWGVIHGLGWVIVLTDGWITQTNVLALVGFVLMIYSMWRINVAINKTPEDEAFDEVERKQRDAEGWRKRQIVSMKTSVESFDEWGHSHRPQEYWVERRAYLAGFDAGARNERLRKELND